MTPPDAPHDGKIAISIEGTGPTVVDALAAVLLGAQDRLRAIESATDDAEEPEGDR